MIVDQSKNQMFAESKSIHINLHEFAIDQISTPEKLTIIINDYLIIS
jgi:hypothetical protein